jgi:hypothetical protein
MNPGREPVTIGPGSRNALLALTRGWIRLASGNVYTLPEACRINDRPWFMLPMQLPTQRTLADRLGMIEIGDVTQLPALSIETQAQIAARGWGGVWARLTERGYVAARHLILHPRTFVVPTRPMPVDTIRSTTLGTISG